MDPFRPLLPPANVVCEGYVFTGVCLSTGGSPCQAPPPAGRPPSKETLWQGDPPPRQGGPPGRETPPARRPPQQSMLGDMVNAQAVRILLECNLVHIVTMGTMLNFNESNKRGVSAPGGACSRGVVSALGGVCSRGCLVSDVCSQGGACLWSVKVCIPACNGADPPVNRITDTCKNITLPQLRCGR